MSTTRRRGLIAVLAAALAAVIVAFGLGGAAQAATLFSDDFNDNSADGWSKSGGDWAVVSDGSPTFTQSKTDSELAREFAGSTGWTSYSVQARVKPLGFSGSNRVVALAARSSSASKMYRLALTNANRAELQAVDGSSVTVIGSAALTVSVGTWYTLRIDADGSTISGFVNGTRIGSGSNSAHSAGRIGLVTVFASARFDDVVVSTVGSTPPTGNPTNPPTGNPTNPPTGPPTQPQTGLVGWATQGGGTNGGGSAAATTVTSSSALSSAVSGSTARVVRVSGTISCSGMITVGSNKTILGNSGAVIAGCGLNVSNASNVIIRNISFRDWDDDAVNVQYSTRVWVDHNSFTNGYDGAVDVKRASDFVTISWNRVYGHDKSMLLGHSDDNAGEDVGHLRVTYHHNWFDGSGTRHPRVRFGNPVHVYNNYYNGNEYGVASTMDAGVLVEGNYFENVDDPTLVGYADSDPGDLVQRNNVFVGSGTPQSAGSTASIPYSYQLDNANGVKSSVTAGAGAGRINP
ncbi:MAG TPA: right-handed parallel beta-helix repeat-containing protein [Asanoa sp.]|jgi:pectate lyase|nr:right-handed parallel beta-helix repeat-containing protein [Asanoa sp.]